MRRSPRTVRALVVTLAIGLSLTACGDKKPSTDAGGAGSTKTFAPPAAKALTAADFSDRVFSALEKAGSAKVHFQAGASGQSVQGDGEIKYGDELAVRMRMTPPSQASAAPQEMLLIGTTIYISMGGKYMSMPTDALKSMGVPDMSANLDPKIQAKAFKTGVTKFEKSGDPVTLDGVQATPYDVTIDPTKAPDVFGTAVTEPISMTYYIGPDDLLRKMVYKDKNGDFVATYTDWGAPVTIEAPAASDVMTGMAPDAGFDDDVALLLYRHPGPLELDFPADATRLATVRSALRGWLGLIADDVEDRRNVLVAAGEACANAIEHGHRRATGGRIRLRAAATAGELRLTIADSGRWRTPRPDENTHRGRGFLLMRELMSEVTVTTGAAGTIVDLKARIAR